MATEERTLASENRSFVTDGTGTHTSLIKARITTNVSRIESYSKIICYNS
ncbi:MAG: hypothetical protein G01um101433_674, partial [Parcubacteria group bacterium Gr01-1014_33]